MVYINAVGLCFFLLFNCCVCVPSPGNAEPCGHKGASWHLSCGRSTLGPKSRLGGGAVGSRASLNQEHFSPHWRRELACTSQRRVGGEGDGPPKGPEPQQKEKE